MKKLKRGTDNQTIGLLPFLLLIGLNIYLPYLLSFVLSVVFSVFCFFLFRRLRGVEMSQFMLYPVAVTQVFYSVAMLLCSEEFLSGHSVLMIEILFVIVLSITSFQKRSMMRRIRNVEISSDKQSYLKASVSEFFFTVQIAQNLYGLHLLTVLFYLLLPETERSASVGTVLIKYMPIIIGLVIILYEQIRLSIMRGYLKNEVWLPVLNDEGKVIGRIAQSISSASSRKFYHPVVRVAVVYNGMLYLTRRSRDSVISPGTLDYPFKHYVRYKQGIEEAVYESLSGSYNRETVSPRFLIRYKFENETVKHQVSVYVVYLRTEEQFDNCKDLSGKLWTPEQIEENLGTGLFSEYFEKEFTYLQNTVLMVERYCCQDNNYELEV